jgi:cellulose synthase/poly-beta-1,6-N-acetylglucosamine synthase-like glycosyltransferase
MRALFWVSLGFVLYVYAGYPLLLAVVARLRSRGVRREPVRHPAPGVSVVIAARNEAPQLASRIENLLAQDYPGPLQLIVVSDGSTDGTAAALAVRRARGSGRDSSLRKAIRAEHGRGPRAVRLSCVR